MKKQRTEVVAAIDVGSNSVRMIIAEISPVGEIIILEDLHKSTNIGRDTFSFGKISSDSIYETVETLEGFERLMKDYNIKKYKAVSTSGIREASNKEYVLEQVRLRTGIQLETINNAQERFYIYKGMWERISKFSSKQNEGLLIINIGSGGVEVSVYNDGNLKFTEYIKIGSLRIRETLSELENSTLNFSKVMKEFIDSSIYSIKPYIKEADIKNFIGLGGEISTICNACLNIKKNKDGFFIKRLELENLYLKLSNMTTSRIIDEYKIPRSTAELILPSIMIFATFLSMTKAEGVHAPMVSLRHGIVADIADELVNTKRGKESYKDIISSVWYINEKYKSNKKHTSYVEQTALKIFDFTRKIHRLDDKERFHLRVSAILHDIGKYINLNKHDVNSYNIIASQDILGFSNSELGLIANVVKYHSEYTPNNRDESYKTMDNDMKIIISKLSAILKIAESLDISHKQKIEDIRVSITGREICFIINSKQDTTLEEWSFKGSCKFFEEVMGYKTIIKHKG